MKKSWCVLWAGKYGIYKFFPVQGLIVFLNYFHYIWNHWIYVCVCVCVICILHFMRKDRH